MAWYCYWSPKKEAEWQLALASERPKLETGNKAEFTTALDLNADFSDPNTEHSKVHYRGPFYVDFDSADIAEAIEQFKKFLNNLVDEYEIDLNSISIYASGGKGFHAVIPTALFLDKPSAAGYQGLPMRYKEMAQAMFFDTLDLSVYTAKRGRMWRVANFKRTNNHYKVQISAEEALNMTVEQYDVVTSAPRPALALTKPELSGKLALLFTQASDRVENHLKKNGNRKRDTNLLAKFEGRIPPTITQLMAGEGIKPDIGFQSIATQLAVAAHALGMTKVDFIAGCEGICQNHQGDGTRYGSFRLRKKELERMFDYMADNPMYEFSAGAIKGLIVGNAPDLNTGEVTDVDAEGKSQMSLTLGMSVTKAGIYKLNSEGFRVAVCGIGIDNVQYLQHLATGAAIGYQVDVFVDGKYKTKKRLTMDYFSSKARFQGFTMAAGAVGCQASDNQIAALADVMRKVAVTNEENGIVYVVNREGLDLVPLADQPGEFDLIWMSPDKVLSKRGISYAFVDGIYGGEDMPYKTDLLNAPLIPHPKGNRRDGEKYLKPEEVAQLKEDLHNLFRINSPTQVAKLVGWTMAAFIAPVLRKEFKQFPLLHIYGTSGAGKSSTTDMLARFQYHINPPVMMSASGSTAVPFTLKSTGTASMILWVDEYKPSEMQHGEANRMKYILRTSYDGLQVGRGRVAKESGESHVVTQSQRQLAPIAFMAEFMETQKAIVERCVIVGLREQDNKKHAEWFKALGNPQYFGSVGRLLVETILFRYEPEVFHKALREAEEKIKEYLGDTQGPRPIYNLAVAATGLRLLQRALAAFFETEFDAELESLILCLTSPSDSLASEIAPVIKSEIIQVINTLAFLTKCDDAPDDSRMMLGRDYATFGDYVEIHARKSFMKYQKHCRAHGEKPLFASSEPFVAALKNYGGATKLATSLLGSADVYRLDYHRIYSMDGVEVFGND